MTLLELITAVGIVYFVSNCLICDPIVLLFAVCFLFILLKWGPLKIRLPWQKTLLSLWDAFSEAALLILWQESSRKHAACIARCVSEHPIAVCIFSNSHQGLIALACLAPWCWVAPPVHLTYKITLTHTVKSWPPLAS